MHFGHLDTTSMSFYGEDSPGEVEITDKTTAEVPVNVTYVYSHDHRPDLKQVIQELAISTFQETSTYVPLKEQKYPDY